MALGSGGRYLVDLASLHALCERNYHALLRLIPGMRNGLKERHIFCPDPGDVSAQLVLRVMENNPYTTRLSLCHRSPLCWLPEATMVIHAYHDARMADVVGGRDGRQLAGVYPYPNAGMYQPDEKVQLAQYLSEWLEHCLAYGYEVDRLPVVSGSTGSPELD